jgi:hypothetical protein
MQDTGRVWRYGRRSSQSLEVSSDSESEWLSAESNQSARSPKLASLVSCPRCSAARQSVRQITAFSQNGLEPDR